MSRRFFVPPPALDDDDVVLGGALAHRLSRVLRLGAGDEIVLFDGTGGEAAARIDAIGERETRARIIGRRDGVPEPSVRVHLYQSITKGERFEWLLEKATEIGAARFVPLLTARAVVKTAGGGNRAERWQRIVTEAAEQCERTVVPPIDAPRALDDALASAPGLLLLPYEAAHAATPTIAEALAADIDALFAAGEVSIFIGPEGGYEPAEVERARAAGALVVTMGPRVLRSETAGLVALTLVLQATGQLG